MGDPPLQHIDNCQLLRTLAITVPLSAAKQLRVTRAAQASQALPRLLAAITNKYPSRRRKTQRAVKDSTRVKNPVISPRAPLRVLACTLMPKTILKIYLRK